MNKKLYDAIAKGNVSYFYNCWIWRKKRKEILIRDNNECQPCKRKGKVTAGTKDRPLIVHHKKHLKDRPDLALTNSNLETCCYFCHELEHPEKLEAMNKDKKKITYMNEERW